MPVGGGTAPSSPVFRNARAVESAVNVVRMCEESVSIAARSSARRFAARESDWLLGIRTSCITGL